MVAVVVALLSAAVIVALPVEVIVPAVAVKIALVALAGTETEAGTARLALLEDRLTVVAEVREALDSVTVQELVAVDAKVAGEHCTEERLTGACKLMVAVAVVPLSVAVIVALPLADTVPAVAVNVADVEFLEIVTEEGTVRVPVLEDKLTEVLLVAALESVTVHVVLALEARLEAVH